MIFVSGKFGLYSIVLACMIATLAPGAEPAPVEFARFDAYCEGPVFDYDGNLFVSHGKSSVAKILPDGQVVPWLKVQSPNGHKILPDGNHLLCVAGAVLHVDPNGTIIRKVCSEYDGKPLRAPNDITLARNGGFYFSDPGGSREKPIGAVYFVDRNEVTHLVAGGMWVPNGLVLSPNGQTLYVAETVPNRILYFRVAENGKLGPLNVFANLPSKPGVQAEPDGLAVDECGNVYVAHLGMSSVQVLSPTGELLKTLPAGNYDASNLVFGGPQRRRLYVTGSIGHRSNSPGRVYALQLDGPKGGSSLQPRKRSNTKRQ